MGGKKGGSDGLGRALIKQHNQMARQSKEKGRALRLEQRRVLESVTEVSDIDAILEKAAEADRVYSFDNPSPHVLINLDASSDMDGVPVEERRKLQKQEEALHASSLRVPRRPPWNAQMSVEELDSNENQAFLEWRRNLARLEENDKLVLTPFEKNLDIWRQLWRVLERSDLEYAREIDEHKGTLLLVNKADLLPIAIRCKWAEYFNHHGILFVFWSAKAATAALEGKQLIGQFEEEKASKELIHSDLDTKIYSRDELLVRLQSEAESIAAYRRFTDMESHGGKHSETGSINLTAKQVVVGFVGYPNVGKSSTINALVGQKRTGVTSTPGKTKHFQTLIISDELVLCDCPGLVFPSFSSSRYEMIASGVLPIDRMTEHREAMQVVANRVPRNVLESVYNITLPKPKAYEAQSRPPLSSELLRTYCSSRGYVSSSGLPDETRAARQILKDYVDGKLPHFELPPGAEDEDVEVNATDDMVDPNSLTDNEPDACDSDEATISDVTGVDAREHALSIALNDLESFDLAGELSSNKAAAAKKKSSDSTQKHHKKPQRKKDRSWRVGNDDGDGMPVRQQFELPREDLQSLKDAELLSSPLLLEKEIPEMIYNLGTGRFLSASVTMWLRVISLSEVQPLSAMVSSNSSRSICRTFRTPASPSAAKENTTGLPICNHGAKKQIKIDSL
ncbi:Large subunit GTPase 1 [Musa troglodytarum]|uniref:Large subunit GTPase 1 n=1 Tax=Musa troglodytarum TaxID=320322 RepID=A0A9E7GMA6_9LILI|nr:Large subunit GTPase 1 [Musa troglodytarum]